jgi:hypothetical protein
MIGIIANRQVRLYLISTTLLLAGLGSAIVIFFTAGTDTDSASGYHVVGGYIYPGMHEQNKKYIHDLELYGGKAAVYADEFNQWFFGLWHGKSLAYTIAVLTLIMSLAVYLLAKYSSGAPDSPGEDRKKSNADQSRNDI